MTLINTVTSLCLKGQAGLITQSEWWSEKWLFLRDFEWAIVVFIFHSGVI